MKPIEFFFVTVLLLVTSCSANHSMESPSGENAANAVDSITPEKTIGWELMNASVLKVCLDCHAGRKAPTLATLAQVTAHMTKVWSTVSTGSMPPARAGYAPLSKCQSALLKKWMDLGMPQDSTVLVGSIADCPQGQAKLTPIAEMPLNYETLSTRILQNRCNKCHNTSDTSDASLILFSPYSTIAEDTSYVTSPAAESKMVLSLRSTDLEKRMPPPEDGDALSEDEIQFVERWIEAGKPQF